MVTGIEHLGVCAKDSAALKDWYVKTFGTKVVYDNGKGTYFVAFENGDMLEIMSADDDGAEYAEKTKGVRHIALSIDNDSFDEVVKILKADSAVTEIHDVSESAKGIKTYWFCDIEGNFMHLIYRPTPLV